MFVVDAILTFAVDVRTERFNLDTIGNILMVVGVIGLLLSLLFWSSFSPYRRRVGPVLSDERSEPPHRPPVRTTAPRCPSARRMLARLTRGFLTSLVGESGSRYGSLPLLTRSGTAHDAHGDSHRRR